MVTLFNRRKKKEDPDKDMLYVYMVLTAYAWKYGSDEARRLVDIIIKMVKEAGVPPGGFKKEKE